MIGTEKHYTGVCVGGPVDGQVKFMEDRQYFQVMEMPKELSALDVSVETPSAVSVKTVTYRQEALCADNVCFYCYVPEDHSSSQMLGRLLDGYVDRTGVHQKKGYLKALDDVAQLIKNATENGHRQHWDTELLDQLYLLKKECSR